MALMRFRSLPPALDPSKDVMDIRTQMSRLFDNLIGQSQRKMMKRAQGERQWSDETREAGHCRQERWSGKFERALSLPIPVETGQVKATYRDGVLTVKLPKTEGVKPREIKIDAV